MPKTGLGTKSVPFALSPKVAEGAGAVLQLGRGGRMAGAKPEVDGAQVGLEGTAKTAKYTKHTKKKTQLALALQGRRG